MQAVSGQRSRPGRRGRQGVLADLADYSQRPGIGEAGRCGVRPVHGRGYADQDGEAEEALPLGEGGEGGQEAHGGGHLQEQLHYVVDQEYLQSQGNARAQAEVGRLEIDVGVGAHAEEEVQDVDDLVGVHDPVVGAEEQVAGSGEVVADLEVEGRRADDQHGIGVAELQTQPEVALALGRSAHGAERQQNHDDREKLQTVLHGPPLFFRIFHLLRESNPCCRDENPVS